MIVKITWGDALTLAAGPESDGSQATVVSKWKAAGEESVSFQVSIVSFRKHVGIAARCSKAADARWKG